MSDPFSNPAKSPPHGILFSSKHRLVNVDAWRVGTRETTPEQIEEMSFTTRRVKRLPRDVAAAVAADLPASPVHPCGRPARHRATSTTLSNTRLLWHFSVVKSHFVSSTHILNHTLNCLSISILSFDSREIFMSFSSGISCQINELTFSPFRKSLSHFE